MVGGPSIVFVCSGMSACDTQTFSKITPDTWKLLVLKAAENGIQIAGDSGQSSKEGFTFRWLYDPAAQTLELQCLDKPFWAPCSAINAKIQSVAASFLG